MSDSVKETIKVSVIIVNYNTPRVTTACIASILKQEFRYPYEIIVVDNHSSDDSAALFKAQFPTITVIQNPQNLGFAGGNNVGIEASTGEFILLLNSDTELVDNRLDDLVDFMQQHKDIALVTCKLLNSDLSLQYSVRHFPTLFSVVLDTFMLTALFWRVPFLRRFTLNDLDYSVPRDIEQAAGAFMLVPATLFDKIGKLDERFFMYYEDVDFCLRIHKSNLRVYLKPEVNIIHHAGATFRLHRVNATAQRLASKTVYFQKHAPQILLPVRMLVTVELFWRTLLALSLFPIMNRRYRLDFSVIGTSFQSALHSIWQK